MTRRYQASRMSMAQGELRVQSLLCQVEEKSMQVDSLQQQLARQREELEAAQTEELCVICMEGAASHVFVPCGHLAVCERCVQMACVQCPVCRQDVERVVRVFRP